MEPPDEGDRLIIAIERLGSGLVTLPYSGAEKVVLEHARSRVGDALQTPTHGDVSNFIEASLKEVLHEQQLLSNHVTLVGHAQRVDRQDGPVYRLNTYLQYKSAVDTLNGHGYAGGLALTGALEETVDRLNGTCEVLITDADPQLTIRKVSAV